MTQDSALDAAVSDAVQDAASTPGLLVTGYLVLAATSGFDDDGDRVTAVTILPGDLPVHECLGLLEHARIRFHADTLDSYRGDDL